MGVPDTTTFDLQDVVDEVNPTTDDLVDCFADAISSKFDSAYEGSKNQLLNFRNYGAVTCTSFLSSSFNFKGSGCDASASEQNVSYYHNGTGASPAVDDIVYQNPSCTTILGGARRPYYAASGSAPVSGFVTNTSGVVTSVSSC